MVAMVGVMVGGLFTPAREEAETFGDRWPTYTELCGDDGGWIWRWRWERD